MWHNEAVTRLQPRMERKSKMKKKVLSIYSAMIALMLAVMLVVPGFGNVLNAHAETTEEAPTAVPAATEIPAEEPAEPLDGSIVLVTVDDEQNNGNPVLKAGDYVTHINGKSVDDEDFEEYLYNVTDDVLTVTYVRDGKTNDVELTPKYVDTVNSRGIALIPYEIDSPANFFKALAYAAKMPPTIWNITVRGIKDAIAGKVKAYNLVSGPIGITTMVNDVVAAEEDTVGENS